MSGQMPSNPFTVSRRTTLQMALATLMGGQFAGLPRFASAEDAASGTWNPLGNAGRTGELPGPGLDLEGALGELWRLPVDQLGRELEYRLWARDFGYANGLFHVGIHNNDEDSEYLEYLWSGDLETGEFLWRQNLTELAKPGSPIASQATDTAKPRFLPLITIDSGLLLVISDYDHLLALDTMTGEIRWDYDLGESGSHWALPVVANHIAFCGGDSITAVELGERPTVRWKTEIAGEVIGVDRGFVYIAAGDYGQELRALRVEDGSEYWRTSLYGHGGLDYWYGVSSGRTLIEADDYLVAVDDAGQVVWSADNEGYSTEQISILGETATRVGGGIGYAWN